MAEQPDALGDRRRGTTSVAIVSYHAVLIASRPRRRARDVVAHGDVVEPGALGGLRDLRQLGGGRAGSHGSP